MRSSALTIGIDAIIAFLPCSFCCVKAKHMLLQKTRHSRLHHRIRIAKQAGTLVLGSQSPKLLVNKVQFMNNSCCGTLCTTNGRIHLKCMHTHTYSNTHTYTLTHMHTLPEESIMMYISRSFSDTVPNSW